MTNADVLNDLLTKLETDEFKISRFFKNIKHIEAYTDGVKDCFEWVKYIINSEIQEGERYEIDDLLDYYNYLNDHHGDTDLIKVRYVKQKLEGILKLNCDAGEGGVR